MKKWPLYTFVLMLGLYGCSSQKKLGKEAPFTIMEPSCQEYAGGRPEAGTGFILKIPVEGVPSTLSFENVYFRGHVLKPEVIEEKGGTMLVCEFQRGVPERPKDMIMHADPMEEVGNQPPALVGEKEDDFPFELKGDEAVVEYKETGKKKSGYFKISGIKDKMPVQYPSRPQN